jgi:hypothetical protein
VKLMKNQKSLNGNLNTDAVRFYQDPKLPWCGDGWRFAKVS